MSRPLPPSHNNIFLQSNDKVHLTDDVKKLFYQGLSLHKKGELDQAGNIYAEILKLNPKHFDSIQLTAAIAAQNKQWSLALSLFLKALAINSKSSVVFYNLGIVYQALNLLDNALINYNQAIKFNPAYAEAYSNLGNLFNELNQLKEAVFNFDKAIELKPDYAVAYFNRGNVYKKLNLLDKALQSYDKAIEFKPDYAEAYSNRGILLRDTMYFDEALESFDKAIELKHDYADAYSNRGVVLNELKYFDKALQNFDKSIELKNDSADAYWNKSLLLLTLQDFENGWHLYEWRWKSIQKDYVRSFRQPLWQGVESLAGKTILLYAEQGLGDTIQFYRYIALVKNLGATVLFESPKALIPLLIDLDDVDQLIETGGKLPAFDYQCPLLSLPLAFKTELHSIPSPTPYLRSLTDKLKIWKQRLGEKSKPRIGLMWCGNPSQKDDHKRSQVLADVIKYLPPNFEYVSLQKEVRDVDRLTLTNSFIKHYDELIVDFTDTAALCDLMDVVICVCTSVAHLAGALGKPTWIMLPYRSDWRWFLDRDDSPWYESVKLYRQDEDRQWAPVLERVARDLKELNTSFSSLGLPISRWRNLFHSRYEI